MSYLILRLRPVFCHYHVLSTVEESSKRLYYDEEKKQVEKKIKKTKKKKSHLHRFSSFFFLLLTLLVQPQPSKLLVQLVHLLLLLLLLNLLGLLGPLLGPLLAPSLDPSLVSSLSVLLLLLLSNLLSIYEPQAHSFLELAPGQCPITAFAASGILWESNNPPADCSNKINIEYCMQTKIEIDIQSRLLRLLRARRPPFSTPEPALSA